MRPGSATGNPCRTRPAFGGANEVLVRASVMGRATVFEAAAGRLRPSGRARYRMERPSGPPGASEAAKACRYRARRTCRYRAARDELRVARPRQGLSHPPWLSRWSLFRAAVATIGADPASWI